MPQRLQLAPWSAWVLALLGLAGCRGANPELPVDGHRELCCKAANPDNVSFVGCRATTYCRTNESVWVRGPITCSPEGTPNCAGARCCKLDVEAVATRGGALSVVKGLVEEASAEPKPPASAP
ncbi:hypothetical protein, partial [Enhygromyxa salina]|uniref:hypothetical protein n=1 Tax=Enhygromyxa salina TaxID=215803 RepID=UPI0011B2367B